MKKPAPPTTAAAIPLPAGILKADCEHQKYNPKKPDHVVAHLTFHYTARFGWCVATLPISGSRGFKAARTYAISVKDNQIVTVGAGPHVLRTLNVGVRESRLAALQVYLDLKLKGEGTAGEIRDRISTRRAQSIYRRML